MATAMESFVTALVRRFGLLEAFNDPNTAEFHLRVAREPYMPLVIERLYMPDHGRRCVSVCHFYLQNGDVMRDPEMVFDPSDGWKPLYFRTDSLIEQYVFEPPHQRTHYRPRLLRQLVSFQAQWTRNLREQAFLDGDCQAESNTHQTRVSELF